MLIALRSVFLLVWGVALLFGCSQSDNSPPTIQAGPSAPTLTLPNQISNISTGLTSIAASVTFSDAVYADAHRTPITSGSGAFAVSLVGCASTTLDQSATGVSTADNLHFTVNINLGGCVNGDHVALSVVPDHVFNATGVPFASTDPNRTVVTYILDVGPTIALALKSGSPSTFSSTTPTVLQGTFSSAASGGQFTASSVQLLGAATNCVTAIDQTNVHSPVISTDSFLLTISGCAVNGTLLASVSNSWIRDAAGVNGQGNTNAVSLIVANPAPALISSSPTNNAGFSTVPTSLSLTFDKEVSTTLAKFSLSGSCKTLPTLQSLSGSGTTTLSLVLSGGTCTYGQTLVLSINRADIADSFGNVGSGSLTLTASDNFKLRIFVSNRVSGDAGIAGMDAVCAQDASAFNLTGTYKAMVVDGVHRIACTTANCSGGTSEHVDWVLRPDVGYYGPSGYLSATTSAGLLTFPMANYLYPQTAAWTGLNTNWTTSSDTCSGWTSTYAGYGGMCGIASFTSIFAFTGSPSACSYTFGVYCVEQ